VVSVEVMITWGRRDVGEVLISYINGSLENGMF
jgi:hypothetical protein